jgi:hypothetical protein
MMPFDRGAPLAMLERLVFAVDMLKRLVGLRFEQSVDEGWALALASYPCGSTGIRLPKE